MRFQPEFFSPPAKTQSVEHFAAEGSRLSCVGLWEMCDPLLIFMDIPVIPKTFDRDFYLLLGLCFAENLSCPRVLLQQVDFCCASASCQQFLELSPTENSPGP